jgi:hypothetical protein
LKEKLPYKPNRISAEERTWSIVISVILMVYGITSIYMNDMVFPGGGKYGEVKERLHLQGFPLWMMFLAFAAASANLLSVVADHYDKRDNQINYKRFGKICRIIGWIFCLTTLMFYVIQNAT